MKTIITLLLLILASVSMFSCSSSEAKEDTCNNCKTTQFSIQGEYLTTKVLKVVDSTNTIIRYDSSITSNYNGKVFHRTLIQK